MPVELQVRGILVFDDEPYGQPTIGWEKHIRVIDVADCERFYSRWYTPEQILIVVAGDIDPQNAIETIRRSYGTLERTPKIPTPVRETVFAPLEARTEHVEALLGRRRVAMRPCCILSACEAECCILLAFGVKRSGRLLLCRTPAAYRAGGGPGTHRTVACPPYSPPIGGARQRARPTPTHTTRKPTSSPPPKISGCLGGRGVPGGIACTHAEGARLLSTRCLRKILRSCAENSCSEPIGSGTSKLLSALHCVATFESASQSDP